MVSVFNISDKIHENSGVWLWRVGWKVSATHLMLSSKSTMEMIIVRTIFVMRRIYPYHKHDITSITARVTKPLDSKYEPPKNIISNPGEVQHLTGGSGSLTLATMMDSPMSVRGDLKQKLNMNQNKYNKQ